MGFGLPRKFLKLELGPQVAQNLCFFKIFGLSMYGRKHDTTSTAKTDNFSRQNR
mgnify:CR=1 FL=1